MSLRGCRILLCVIVIVVSETRRISSMVEIVSWNGAIAISANTRPAPLEFSPSKMWHGTERRFQGRETESW